MIDCFGVRFVVYFDFKKRVIKFVNWAFRKIVGLLLGFLRFFEAEQYLDSFMRFWFKLRLIIMKK